MYLVKSMKSKLTVTVLGIKTKMELNWADGMVGAIPVFETKEQAEKYADGTGVCELIIANKKGLTHDTNTD